jgi:hypothetical protein
VGKMSSLFRRSGPNESQYGKSAVGFQSLGPDFMSLHEIAAFTCAGLMVLSMIFGRWS